MKLVMLFLPKFITSIVSLQPQKFSRVMFFNVHMKAQNFNFLIILYSIKFVLLCELYTDVYYQGDDVISLKISLMESNYVFILTYGIFWCLLPVDMLIVSSC